MRALDGLPAIGIAVALAACGGPAAPLKATCRLGETGVLELAFGADHADEQADGTIHLRARNETSVPLELHAADEPGAPIATLAPGTAADVVLPVGRGEVSLRCVDPRPDGLVQGGQPDAPEYATVRVLNGIPWQGG